VLLPRAGLVAAFAAQTLFCLLRGNLLEKVASPVPSSLHPFSPFFDSPLQQPAMSKKATSKASKIGSKVGLIPNRRIFRQFLDTRFSFFPAQKKTEGMIGELSCQNKACESNARAHYKVFYWQAVRPRCAAEQPNAEKADITQGTRHSIPVTGRIGVARIRASLILKLFFYFSL
jgi:hypothetical protein